MQQITIFELLEQTSNVNTGSIQKGSDVKKNQAEILSELHKIGKELIENMKKNNFKKPFYFAGLRLYQESSIGPYLSFGFERQNSGLIEKEDLIEIYKIKGPTLGNTRAHALRTIESGKEVK